MAETIVEIQELDPEIIAPCTARMNDPTYGGNKTVIIGKPGCFAAGTEVLMYDGTIKRVEDVQVGDVVMGDDSTPRNVLELCHNYDTMYKIIPVKGESVIVNENHILSLNFYNRYRIRETVIDISLKEYLRQTTAFKESCNWYRTAVDFPEKETEIDPYILGQWLGSVQPTNEVVNSKFFKFLQKNSLIKEKYIPQHFKVNSVQKRLRLLAGILESYDLTDKKTYICFVSTKRMLDDMLFLCRSLGFHASKTADHTVMISGIINIVNTSMSKRNISINDLQKTNSMRFTVEKLEYGEYFGFTLDGNHRFVLGDFSVTHNTGKSTLIASLLYAKKHIIPVGMVMSGTEDSNSFFRKIFPSTFVYNEYDEEQIKSFIKRQKIAKQHLENPWAVIILDDTTDDPRVFNTPLQQGMYKRGRHWKMWYIVSLQYGMDVKPVIRTNIDGVFILREPSLRTRKILWENYASVIPDFTLFCDIMDGVTDDYTALYVHNSIQTNDWRECVFWYKAKPTPDGFKFGCDEFHQFHKDRYNPDYIDPLDKI